MSLDIKLCILTTTYLDYYNPLYLGPAHKGYSEVSCGPKCTSLYAVWLFNIGSTNHQF